MEKFKVKKKHLTGEIADFPKRVVQAMVDEQVRQGNPADPRVFARERTANKDGGGFTWIESPMIFFWTEIIREKKFHLIPKREKPSVEYPRIKTKRDIICARHIAQSATVQPCNRAMYSVRCTPCNCATVQPCNRAIVQVCSRFEIELHFRPSCNVQYIYIYHN